MEKDRAIPTCSFFIYLASRLTWFALLPNSSSLPYRMEKRLQMKMKTLNKIMHFCLTLFFMKFEYNIPSVQTELYTWCLNFCLLEGSFLTSIFLSMCYDSMMGPSVYFISWWAPGPPYFMMVPSVLFIPWCAQVSTSFQDGPKCPPHFKMGPSVHLFSWWAQVFISFQDGPKCPPYFMMGPSVHPFSWWAQKS